MKVTLTSMSGNTRNKQLQSKQEVLNFIDLFDFGYLLLDSEIHFKDLVFQFYLSY